MAEEKDVIAKISPKYGKPLASYKIVYDSPQNQLEPVYYWLLDFIEGLGFSVEKLTDNFMSAPGSGHFSEMGQRATLMQQQGGKISGDLHQLIKSTLNLVYDLREFEQRLAHYKDANSDDKKTQDAGIMALKQIWLDSVDLPKRGRGSIHQMTSDLGYVTLRDAFMVATSAEDAEKMASEGGVVNDAVKRILIPRLDEFDKWKKYSYHELNKRYQIEKSYLRSQVETIKLYASWMRPYFKAAEQLRQKGFEKSAALVNAFSTSMFELTLFGTRKASPPKQVGKTRDMWGNLTGYNIKRDYYSCVVINLKYRGHLAQKADQKGNYAFAFGGKTEITFDSYALNQEELDLFHKELEKNDLEDGMSYSFDIAKDAMDQLKEDFDYFLKDEDERDLEEKTKAAKKKNENDINPFTALFDLFKPSTYGGAKSKKGKGEEISSAKGIKPDNWVEQHLRTEAANGAAGSLYTTYDIYKKSHRMPASSVDFDNYKEKDVSPKVGLKEAFKKPDK